MPKLTKSWIPKTKAPFDSSMLNIGEMMEVDDINYSDQRGEIAMKILNGLICLNDGKPWYNTTRLQGRNSYQANQSH